MKISCRKKIALDSRKEAILVPVYKNIRSLRLLTGKKLDDELQNIIASDYFNFDEKEIKSFYMEMNKKLKKVYLVHVPKEADEPRVYIELGAKFARILKTDKIYSFSVVSFEDIYQEKKDFNYTRSFLEGIMFGLYSFDRYLTRKDPFEVDEVEVITGSNKLKKFVDDNHHEWQTVFDCVRLCRDLVNTPPADLTPKIFADTAQELRDAVVEELEKDTLKITIWDENTIAEKGANLITAVGRGSSNPPRMVMLEYTGVPKSKKHIALVGKGVTFDSGGSNLKPSGSIEDMKCDMAGAALVLSVTLALARSEIPVNVRTYIPLVENILGANAYKPGDVIASMAGKTVEITNTDAEGRLILADALNVAIQADPEIVIDVATLTGAVVASLGEWCAGFFTNRRFLAKQLDDMGYDLGEDVWELPLFEPYAKKMKGKISDLVNAAEKGKGGAILAALFLREFLDNYPWIHLDIAGTAFMHSDHPVFGTQASGFGVRLVYNFVKTHYCES